MSNVMTFTGHLGNDVEISYTKSGKPALKFNVANNVGYGDNKITTWISVTMYGALASTTSFTDRLKKGQQVFVSGEFSARPYSTNDGTQKYSFVLIATIIEIVGNPPVSSATTTAGYNAATPQATFSPQYQTRYQHTDDDIPF